MNIAIRLLLAHIITDYIVQSEKCVKKKIKNGLKSKFFWLHVLSSGLLVYMILMQWTNWFVPLFIGISHGLIDLWKVNKEKVLNSDTERICNKSNNKTNVKNFFFIDQALHLLTIILAWLYLTNNFANLLTYVKDFFGNNKILVVVTAFVILIWPMGIIIEKITEGFRREISEKNGLNKAGKYIGILERILVLIFILLKQYTLIGFLIAGKSILRMGNDRSARKKAEYVLIGTLISFTAAVIIGLVTNYIIEI